MRSDTVRLLRYAGFLTWGLAGLPLLVLLWQQPALCLDVHYVWWLVCLLIFGLAFALTGWRATKPGYRVRQVASLVLQTATALTMIRLVCSGQEGALLVIVAAQLGWILPL